MSLRLAVEKNVNFDTLFSVPSVFGEAESRRILAMKNERRRAESAAGLLALKRALGDIEPGKIVRDERGRPSFAEALGVDFNISHSGSLSVAAVIDSPFWRVGVDIERVDEKKGNAYERIAERYFSDEEKLHFLNSPTPLEFFKIWTAKEARAKLFGHGLAEIISLDRDVKKDEECTVLHFLIACESEKYVLAVCTNGDDEIDFICSNGINVSAIDINK